MQVSFKSPLVESNAIKISSQTLNNNSLEISMRPEHLLSLIQSGGLANFNIKINIACNN